MCVKSDARPQLPFNSEANEVMSSSTAAADLFEKKICNTDFAYSK